MRRQLCESSEFLSLGIQRDRLMEEGFSHTTRKEKCNIERTEIMRGRGTVGDACPAVQDPPSHLLALRPSPPSPHTEVKLEWPGFVPLLWHALARLQII